MGQLIPRKSLAELKADVEAAKALVEQINPEFVFHLMRGNPLAGSYDNASEVRQFRQAYQALRTTQRHTQEG